MNNPFVTYWLSTALLICLCLVIGGLIGYAIGFKEGINLWLEDEIDADDDILEAQEVS